MTENEMNYSDVVDAIEVMLEGGQGPEQIRQAVIDGLLTRISYDDQATFDRFFRRYE